MPLNPKYDLVRPNNARLVFKYMMPTEHKPQNVPDGEANPGRWVYYDVDLNSVRAELA